MTQAWPILPAAGCGSRMQADRPKQYLMLAGRLLIDHTLERFLTHPALSSPVLVLAADDPYWPDSRFANDPRIRIAAGGQERYDSVLSGLLALDGDAQEDDWVLVHDIARPCLHHSDIDLLLDARDTCVDGAILATPVRDTMKRSRSAGSSQAVISETVDRDNLWHALTPQMFRYGELIQALRYCQQYHIEITDEASAMESINKFPALITGRNDNIKVTHPQDLALAELFLTQLFSS